MYGQVMAPVSRITLSMIDDLAAGGVGVAGEGHLVQGPAAEMGSLDSKQSRRPQSADFLRTASQISRLSSAGPPYLTDGVSDTDTRPAAVSRMIIFVKDSVCTD